MLHYQDFHDKKITLSEFIDGLTIDDLRQETQEMIQTIQDILADATDADVTFVPHDPDAYDDAAATTEEEGISWTLGHVIVHVTASAEEMAFLATEAARGVPYHGRSRYEIPWETVTTIAECRHYLDECQRMILAYLDSWPQKPHLDNIFIWKDTLEINPIGRFIFGLSHAFNHLDQLREIMRQAKAAH